MSGVWMPTHLIEELLKQLDVDEKGRGVGEFVGNDVQEGFRAEDFILRTSLTPL